MKKLFRKIYYHLIDKIERSLADRPEPGQLYTMREYKMNDFEKMLIKKLTPYGNGKIRIKTIADMYYSTGDYTVRIVIDYDPSGENIDLDQRSFLTEFDDFDRYGLKISKSCCEDKNRVHITVNRHDNQELYNEMINYIYKDKKDKNKFWK